MATYETPYDRYGRKKAVADRISKAKHEDKKAIAKVQPGAPYYLPEDDAPDRALTRAKAQGEYMKKQVGDGYQRDEGVFADTVRTFKNVRAGKFGRDAMEHGDPVLMAGSRRAGREAVAKEAKDELKRESRGKAEYKKGGKVSASSRADGCAKKGKTKGRMV